MICVEIAVKKGPGVEDEVANGEKEEGSLDKEVRKEKGGRVRHHTAEEKQNLRSLSHHFHKIPLNHPKKSPYNPLNTLRFSTNLQMIIRRISMIRN